MIKANLKVKPFSKQTFKGAGDEIYTNSPTSEKGEISYFFTNPVYENEEKKSFSQKPAIGVPVDKVANGEPLNPELSSLDILKKTQKKRRNCGSNFFDFLTGKNSKDAKLTQNQLQKLESKKKDLEKKIKNFFSTNEENAYTSFSKIRDSVVDWLKIVIVDIGGDKDRFNHMLRCEKEAETMANVYDVDPYKPQIGALLHDNAKLLSDKDMLKKAKDYNLDIKGYANKYDSKALTDPSRLHGLVGAAIIADKLGIIDKNIYNGIYYHTPGRAEEGNLFNHTGGKQGQYIGPTERLIPMSDKIDHIYNLSKFEDSLKYIPRTIKFADGLDVINPDYKPSTSVH